MTYQQAIADAAHLRQSLLDHGVKAVSIELVEGRGGQGWSTRSHVGTMGHHIVSRRSQGDTPGLHLVKVGRADLPGPLCNGYGGFDEVARIVCMGYANHPGRGGPYTVPAGTIPTNNGRPYFFGWEMEGGQVLADWTDSYRLFMARCFAGTLDWLGQPAEAHIEHKTWAPTRKVDRLGYTLERARQEILEASDMAQFDEVTAARLQRIADADKTDLTTPGGVFADDWRWALDNDVMTANSQPTDLVSKQEFAAHARRLDRIADTQTGTGLTFGQPYTATFTDPGDTP